MNRPAKSKRPNPRQLAVVFCMIAAATAAGWYVQQRFPRRFAVVEPNVLYRSGQPSTSQLQRLHDDYGIRTVLIVRSGNSQRVPDEKSAAAALAMSVEHIPIKSRVPVSDEEMRRFFACVDDPAHWPVLIHCSAGRHRTGYLCALYRIERQGWTVQQALDEMVSFGFNRKSQTAIEKQLRAYVPGTFAGAPATASAGP